MSLVISNGQIGTNPPVSFPNKSILISSAGIKATDNSGSITLNTGSSLRISQANGIVTPSGLSLAPITTAPSASSSGFSVSGSVAGVVPPAPTITSVALGASAGEVNISFTLSSISCGESISSLTFIAYIGGVEVDSDTTSTLTSPYNFSGLTAGQTYTFKMYAGTASITEGELSDASDPIVAGSVPGAPTFSYGTINNNDGKWQINWYPPSDGGLAIDFTQTQIQIRQGSTSTSDGTLVSSFTNPPYGPFYGQYINGNDGTDYSSPSFTQFTVAGTYQFYVRVRNSLGYGPWSSPRQQTYTPPTAPLTPTSLSGFTGSNWYVMFNVDNGGSTVTQIELDIRQNGSSSSEPNYPSVGNGQFGNYNPTYQIGWQSWAGAYPSFPDLGNAMQYRVRCSNAIGTGPWCNWINFIG